MAGYHIEYSSFRFAMFFMAEYINMITVSAFATTLFLGGPLGPFTIIWPWLSGLIWFGIKVVILLFTLHLDSRHAAARSLRSA